MHKNILFQNDRYENYFTDISFDIFKEFSNLDHFTDISFDIFKEFLRVIFPVQFISSNVTVSFAQILLKLISVAYWLFLFSILTKLRRH